MARPHARKPLTDRAWFRALALCALAAPCATAAPYPAEETPALIAAVLAHPLAASVPALLPAAKLALCACALAPWVAARRGGRIVLGYYATILVIVGIFQNISLATPYGFAWVAGNTAVQLLVAIACARDAGESPGRARPAHLDRRRLWLLAPMALAFAMPYGFDATGAIVPTFDAGVFANEAGVTYCMITPVVVGTLVLFPGSAAPSTLSFASFVGLAFGIANLITWFGLDPASWWMGILHLPLVVASAMGLFCARRMRAQGIATSR